MRPEKLMFSGGNVLKNGRSKCGFGLDFSVDFCSRLLRFIGALFGGVMNGGDDESVVLREIKKRPYWRFFGVYENSLAYSIF